MRVLYPVRTVLHQLHTDAGDLHEERHPYEDDPLRHPQIVPPPVDLPYGIIDLGIEHCKVRGLPEPPRTCVKKYIPVVVAEESLMRSDLSTSTCHTHVCP